MKKSTYYLAGVLLALLLIAYLVMQKPGERSTSSSGIGRLFTLDSVAVDKIEIKAKNSSVVLEKRGAEWFVVQPINYKADQANVAQTIEQIKNLEATSLVSNRPEKQAVFQVDQTGTEVKVFERGVEKAGFIFGKMAGGYNEYYVRKLSSTDVLLVEGAYSYTFNRVLKDWRNKTIDIAPKENIKEIRYQFGDTSFSVERTDSVWTIGKEKAQQSIVEGIVSSLSNLQADDFIDSTMSHKVMAMITYAGIQLRFSYDKTGNKYAVQSSHSPQCYVLDQWKVNQILKRKKEILEPSKK